MQRIEVNGLVYEFDDELFLMTLLDENADRVYEGVASKPPNDPLTLEELREMDGELVWVVQINNELRPFWMLVDAEDESAASRLYCAMFEDYGTEWLAYRRKPEDGETWQQ